MISPLPRSPLAAQAADALRDGIRRGAWGDSLPPEKVLARQLGIGRYSLRAALARLVRDGVVAVHKGRRARIHRRPVARAGDARPELCLLTSSSPGAPSLIGHHLLLELRAELAGRQIGWTEEADARVDRPRPDAYLRQLVAGRRHACWLLVSVPAAVQRWFAQAGVPVLVAGSCHEGVRLPSVDIDYHAVGWHAAGALAQRGHRRVAVVLPSRPMPGDLACRRGFGAYLARRPAPLSVIELDAGPNPAALQHQLDRTFAGPDRPTAVLTLVLKDALGILFHLQRRRLQVPADVSLLSAENSPLLDQGLPELARYSVSPRKQARRIVRYTQALLAGNPLPARSSLITPAFVPGSTLAPPGG
ncbi:MAG: GntR family transcriptional regulator [Opitutaceae bacterium]|nr:GntR family transcriptional regulator [Opitutaceae bacterium]